MYEQLPTEQRETSGEPSSSILQTAARHLPDETQLRDYVRAVYKRRWIALTSFVLVMLISVVTTFSEVPIYEARVRLLIEVDKPNVVDFKEVIEDRSTYDYYQTQYQILQSRSLATKTIEKLGPMQQTGAAQTSPKPAFNIGQLIGATKTTVATWGLRLFQSVPPAMPKPSDESVAESRAIDAFLNPLTVDAVRSSRLVDVRFRSADPVFAARAVNTLAETYIEQNLDFKLSASQDASDWLGKRLAEQRKTVEMTELALQRYREQNDAVSLEERQNIVVQKLGDLNSAVTRGKTELIQREAVYNQLLAAENDPAAVAAFPPILANGYIQQMKSELSQLQGQETQLSEQLGERHPDMIKIRLAIQGTEAKLKTETGNVVQSLRSEYSAARTQEQNLIAALDAQKQEALELNRKAIEYGVLQRDATSNRQIFDSLMQRTKETGISGELRTSNIRVIDKAEVPRYPVSPNKTRNLMTALAIAVGLALALVFLFHRLDNRVTSPDEIPERFGLPLLGLVPAVTLNDNHGSPLVNNGVPPHFAEAFRAVRTNVLFSSADAGTRAIVVTSAAPNEGKTVVASNLAIALAQAGQRVVLLDGDMRRPRIHEVFNQPEEPGLSNVLVGNAPLDEAIRTSDVPRLSLLLSGARPPNPAELLGSARFSELLAKLSEQFDWIVIDSPPVLAVTDAAILAHGICSALFVIAADMTGRPALRAAIGQLGAAGAKFIGGVLNRAHVERNRYYYSQHYRPDYSNYHKH